MSRLFIVIAILTFSLSAFADGENIRRQIRRDHSCLDEESATATRSGARRQLSVRPVNGWEAGRTYRLPVVLVEFSDQSFSMDSPKETYDSLFNVQGYNLGHGPGCVADYFRDQSGGLFSPQFDIIGPVKINAVHKMDTEYNKGLSQLARAASMAASELNHEEYDWNNDKFIECVIFVYAGVGGNETPSIAKGCIWPNTGTLSTINVGGLRVSTFSASPELWCIGGMCGIGTICHEFAHTLALPDFYPVTTSTDADYSVIDEWDLMDGGNFVDYGWCPPNFSAHEKEFVGWGTPTELTETTFVTDMKSVHDGGTCYRIRADLKSSANEFYLLENRQWKGWDYCLPGHGLLITHVDYSDAAWSSFVVNSDKRHYRLHYVNADNHTFPYDEKLYPNKSMYDSFNRNKRLSGTAYPFVSDTLVNRELTDTSTPSAALFNTTKNNVRLMGKPILNIEETDGVISFFFGKDNTAAGISTLDEASHTMDNALYDLTGRRVENPRPGIYVSRGRKVIKYKK